MTKVNKGTPPIDAAIVQFVAEVTASDKQGNANAFDPWPWATLKVGGREGFPDEALLLDSGLIAADNAWKGSSIRRPLYQALQAAQCLELRSKIESGDGRAVLVAIFLCATHGLVMPAWLAGSFVGRYQRVVMGKSRGWEDPEVFGSARPTGANLAGVQARMRFAPWAYDVAMELLVDKPKTKIEKPLYEEIGRKIGKSATRVQELIAQHIKTSDRPPLSFLKECLVARASLVEAFSAWYLVGKDAAAQSKRTGTRKAANVRPKRRKPASG